MAARKAWRWSRLVFGPRVNFKQLKNAAQTLLAGIDR